MESTKTPIEHPGPKTQPKRVVYLVLPSYNDAEDLKKRITDLIRYFFPEDNFRLMFKAHDTFGHHFNHIDKNQKAIKSKIVYRLNCLDYEKFVVGQSFDRNVRCFFLVTFE